MTEILEQLEPIAKILGPNGVKASFSGTEIYDRRSGTYSPGWEVKVAGVYKGASIAFTKSARSLDDAASAAHSQLVEALGLS